jgi:hypothetical protein
MWISPENGPVLLQPSRAYVNHDRLNFGFLLDLVRCDPLISSRDGEADQTGPGT